MPDTPELDWLDTEELPLVELYSEPIPLVSARIAEDGSSGGFAQSKGKGSPVEVEVATVG